MAQFDESKVINSLHTDKAEVGKKYWYADNIVRLKDHIEHDKCDNRGMMRELRSIEGDLFKIGPGGYYLLHPYEEPPKKRMTHRQLAEWISKGNGEYKDTNEFTGEIHNYNEYFYSDECRNDHVEEGIFIRHWDSEEWIEPTVDIYERDCKGGKK